MGQRTESIKVCNKLLLDLTSIFIFTVLFFSAWSVYADTLYWEDTFHRADGAAGNGWSSPNDASGVITGNLLRRTDSGGFRVLYNNTGTALPADYYVTATVPHTTISRNYWGVIGRFLPSGGNGTGVKVFWQAGGANAVGAGHGEYDNDIAITVTNGIPSSWSVDRNHTVTLGFSGPTVRIYLDGQEYGYFSDTTNNQSGTSIGLVGDGGGSNYDVNTIQVTDYLPAGPFSLSSPVVTSGSTSAVVTWETYGHPSSSRVEYGTTNSYGSSSYNATQLTSHSTALSGLQSNTLYHYRVTSVNSTGETQVSSDYTFLTASATGTIHWRDSFDRANGDAGNGWNSVNGASAQIILNRLHRTDGGSYRILYNPAGGSLPADYFVTMIAPHTLVNSSWWGLTGRYLPTDDGIGSGLKVFWTNQGPQNLGVGHAGYNNDSSITVTGGYPASWAQDQDHLITLRFSGATVTVYLDSAEYGYFSDATNNQAGTGIGFVGDGSSGVYDVIDVMATDYLPGKGGGITGVASLKTESTAVITWQTPEAASDSTVEYGTTTAYSSSVSSPAMVTSHAISLSGLTPNTRYHYRVSSRDNQGTVSTSADYTFTTDHHIYSDELTFKTTGSSFAANLTVDSGATILWTFEDGTTSNSATPAKEYGTTDVRVNRLKVTPWSALKIVNIGYDGGDGGTATTPYLSQQNVITVYGMNNIAPYLEQWTSSQNPLGTLDFSNFTSLKIIECFLCQSVTSVNLHNTPALERANFEDNNLSSLDLSESPSLADLRGALNSYPSIFWGSTGADVWHICIRDNPQMTAILPDLSQFPKLRELWIWNTNQSGTLRPASQNLASVIASGNHYTAADFSGAFPSGQYGYIDVSNNNLTSLNIANSPGLATLNARYNVLSQTAVDGVLQQLDGFGTTGDSIDLRDNAVPSSTGFLNIARLRSRGWTVEHAPDSSAPGVVTFSVPATSGSMTVAVSQLTATDNSGVTGYLVNESPSPPSSSAPGWSGTAPAAYTFGSCGSKTLYAWAQDATGNISASRSATVTITCQTVQVTKSGTGSGTITSTPGGISCGSSCNAQFNPGSTVTLIPAPVTGSSFSGWSGACTNLSGNCILQMDSGKQTTAAFTVQDNARTGSQSYGTLGNVVAAVTSGGEIQVRNIIFLEDLIINRAVSFTFKGGYDSDFNSRTGYTTIDGTLTLQGTGTVTLDRVLLQ